MLHRFDDRALLGLRVWEFAGRSLAQPYGRFFLRRLVLRHPWRTLVGLWRYQQFVRQGGGVAVDGQGELALVGAASLAEWRAVAGRRPGSLLVALGFCQKPLPTPDDPVGCPAGRFNHDCLYLAQLDLAVSTEPAPAPACRECALRVLGRQALPAGATLHVMTAALDIAQDVLLPSLEQRRFAAAVLLLCPYSVPPMALALAICGLPALLATYRRGACTNYGQWLRADGGDKPERTAIGEPAGAQVAALLTARATARSESGRPLPRRFVREGNLYVPQV
ncbi:MAG: hypothetical protein FJZ89_10445 [Chloroflexi bacterium]|nr:hypothetical protein [Chloroflexota bacterium]